MLKKLQTALNFHPQEIELTQKTLLTREGKAVDISGDIWQLPYSSRSSSTLRFDRISDKLIKESLIAHVTDRIIRVSTHAGYTAYNDAWREILRHWNINHKENTENQLIELFESAINKARTKHTLWSMYRPIQWYIWAAENLPENGFSPAYALELEAMQIPGNPKGEAVRMEDPSSGPLHRSLELPLLVSALRQDSSQVFRHLQEKVVIALSIAFGRNPANITFLRESDIIKLQSDAEDPCYVIKMPRIKKRQLNPRDDFLEEYIDPVYGAVIDELLLANIELNLTFESKDFRKPEERPLLINILGNQSAIRSQDIENIFSMASCDISSLIHSFVKRHNIISPLTGKLMHVTPRRLRYTLATGLAAEGISKRELARILDHTDTQHVNVYFEMAGNVVEHLDKATAKGFSKYLNFFKGNIINDEQDAVNSERDDKQLIFVDEQNPTDQSDIGICGEASVCHLDPPYSCYLCPKFQPYRHADHEHVLECLLADREMRLEKYEQARLGVQLDEVIAAVAQVAQLCEEHHTNE